MVYSIICNLDSYKARGPDGMSVVVIQMCAPELAYVCSILYNK